MVCKLIVLNNINDYAKEISTGQYKIKYVKQITGKISSK